MDQPSSPPRDPLTLANRIHAIDRPRPHLLWQFLIFAFFTLPAFPITALLLYFRYHTLRYRFDAQGVSISYGIFFRREAFLTYARIQDIHVKRNIVERWLGLGTVEVETAGGAGSGPAARSRSSWLCFVPPPQSTGERAKLPYRARQQAEPSRRQLVSSHQKGLPSLALGVRKRLAGRGKPARKLRCRVLGNGCGSPTPHVSPYFTTRSRGLAGHSGAGTCLLA
jgi:hypothetical protein